MKRIIRVFPRRTNATPEDVLAIVGRKPGLLDEADEVRVSVTFTYDKPRAEKLAKQWKAVAPVTIGGPAYDDFGNDFTPGLYVRRGYVVTTRGCPNKCWFCSAWKREGSIIRELPIMDGYNVLDSNLLAASERHIRAVFDMLRHQRERAEFSGGFEAKRLRAWHADLLLSIRVAQVWFAYDTPDDLEPLIVAGKLLREAGCRPSTLRAYVLVGFPKDTMVKAEKRLRDTYANGFLPMAMLYRDKDGKTTQPWRRFARLWIRVPTVKAMLKSGESARIVEESLIST